MRKLLAVAVVLIACTGAGYAASSSPSGVPAKEVAPSTLGSVWRSNKTASVSRASVKPSPTAVWCSHVLVAFPADSPGPYVPQGVVLTASSDGFSCVGTITSYAWKRNGVAISGATASTYTTQAADAGKTVTVRVNGTVQSADSTNSAQVLGSSLADDEFNGTSPPTSTWTARTDNTNYATFNGWTNIGEGTGYVYIETAYSDRDGDSDATSASDSDSTSEPLDGANGDWTASWMQTNASVTGARYVETKSYYPCDDTTWSAPNSFGWERASWEAPLGGGSGTSEIDLWGNESNTNWGSPSGQLNGDYVLSPGVLSWDATGSFDGDHDGDSVASDPDTPVTQAGDGDEPDGDGDDASVSEAATLRGDNFTQSGPTTYNSSTDKQAVKVCGAWDTYGALVQAHSVKFYFNGTLNYTVYTASAYGSPNLGLASTYDLTTVPEKSILSLEPFQAPPAGTGYTYLCTDYLRVNALS